MSVSAPVPREGSRVSYVGFPGEDMDIGDTGKVLSTAGTASHVLWTSGIRAGQVTLVGNYDLVESRRGSTNDDLDSGGLVSFAVRETYDRQGREGLLNALNEDGHLAMLASYVEEAVDLVSTRISNDPSFAEVIANLDPQDGADFLSFTAGVLLRDSFSEGE